MRGREGGGVCGIEVIGVGFEGLGGVDWSNWTGYADECDEVEKCWNNAGKYVVIVRYGNEMVFRRLFVGSC